ncbi:hypothetical protein AVEN_164464-1 [Araneus ventricosus]|uniref:Uncharacterized protein n=1 Tax=Araneus ventricosus TaxID=182803 RepID=A0A4Y2QAN6_ARAVE|nr:hypothetical protein AVEN_164464-1 [Araneus ventricosus]
MKLKHSSSSFHTIIVIRIQLRARRVLGSKPDSTLHVLLVHVKYDLVGQTCSLWCGAEIWRLMSILLSNCSAEEDRGVTAALQAGFSDESLTADATELLDLEVSNKLHSSTSLDTSSTIKKIF